MGGPAGDEGVNGPKPSTVGDIRSPRPRLSRRAEAALGPRHREVLDLLEVHFLENGFSGATVAALASAVGCSRRTLYELAPSKEDLVLTVLDRFLHRVGRSAIDAIDPATPATVQLRAYFLGGIELHRLTTVFSEELTDLAGAQRLLASHFRHVTRVVERLVGEGIARGELRPTRPGLVAGVLAGSALYFSRPDVVDDLGIPRSTVGDELLDLVEAAIAPLG
jgi:AcrR family transcriptional regulator